MGLFVTTFDVGDFDTIASSMLHRHRTIRMSSPQASTQISLKFYTQKYNIHPERQLRRCNQDHFDIGNLGEEKLRSAELVQTSLWGDWGFKRQIHNWEGK